MTLAIIVLIAFLVVWANDSLKKRQINKHRENVQ